jgi:hypothetical protein
MDSDRSAENINSAVDLTKQSLLALLAAGDIEDLAFIGNASPVYAWTPCQMVDLDCFLFAEALSPALGAKLAALNQDNARQLDDRGVSFELRIIEGPYKPPLPALDRPIVVAHLGVFTDDSYAQAAHLKRWAWRKYACEREGPRLQRLGGDQPTIGEFVHGPRGLDERLAAIRSGSVTMVEWTLPTLSVQRFEVRHDELAFQECCYAYAANCARNHARALGRLEADQLGNDRFFAWYDAVLFKSEDLLRLAALKARCRDVGFDQDTAQVRALTLRYLDALGADLAS